MPVRGEILKADRDFARAQLGVGDKPLVLSFGGSLGAAPINDAMYDILLKSAESGKYYHIHSVGTNGGEYLEKFEKAGFKEGKKAPLKLESILTIWMSAWPLRISL